MSKNELDDLYRRGLDRLSDNDLPWDGTPTWERLDRALDQRKRRRKSGIWWQLAASLTLLIGLGWLGLQVLKQEKTQNKTVEARKNRTSVSSKIAANSQKQRPETKAAQAPPIRLSKLESLRTPDLKRQKQTYDVYKAAHPPVVGTVPRRELETHGPLIAVTSELKIRPVLEHQPTPIKRSIEPTSSPEPGLEPADELKMPRKRRFQLPIALAPHLTRPAASALLPAYSHEKASVQLQIHL